MTALPDPFKAAENQYYSLRGRLAAGRMTQPEFESALRELGVRDASGHFWALSPGGQWLMYDGSAWVEASPSAPGASPPSLPESRAVRPVAPGKPAPSRFASNRLLLMGALIVLLALGFVAATAYVLTLPVASARIPTPAGAPGQAQLPNASPASTPVSPPASPTATPTAPPLAVSNVPGVKASAIARPALQPLLARDFAAQSAQLALKIAALNQAELKFIRDMQATSSAGRPAGLAFPPLQKGALTDEDLKDLAGKAMDVAILAEDLGKFAGQQDKGSDRAAQSAEAFFAIARNALALVIDTQNVRQGLQNGLMPFNQAIDTIASYGAQLWNGAVTDGQTPGNPFTPQAKNAEPVLALNPNAAAQMQPQVNDSSIWIAQSSAQNTRAVNVPAALSPVGNPFDPQAAKSLTTAAGQSDGNKAQQIASANLRALGAKPASSDPSQATQLAVPTSPVAVSGAEQIKAGNLPSFQSGRATVVSGQNSAAANPFMELAGLAGDQTPAANARTTVQDAPALVNIAIDSIVINNVNRRPPGTGSFEADTQVSFRASWSTSLAAPQFKLVCNGGQEIVVTQAGGSITLQANGLLILYPGTLSLYCYASSLNGQSLGSTSVDVLIGDAAGATTRAVQVETDSAVLNITLTADAQATQRVQQTQTAAAQSTRGAAATQTVQAQQTVDALSTEVAKTATAEFRLTAAAFATRQALPPPSTSTPTATPTFAPKVIDQVTHPGDVHAVATKAVLQRGRLYRFTFSGRVNLINPTQSVVAYQLPERVNGVAVPVSGVVVIQGGGGVATITCGGGIPDPKDPGAFVITVEDLGPM